MPADALWIVRHARRRDFDDPSWAATASRPHDPPLSGPGRAQAEALAGLLAAEPLGALYASPFLRCVETAAPLAERRALPIRLERGLSEWLNREWFPTPPALCPVEELARHFPQVDIRYPPRGAAHYGECGEAALRRAGEVARLLAEESRGPIALFGHGASVLGALAGLLERERTELPELDYGGAIALGRSGGRWSVERGPVPPCFGAACRSPRGEAGGQGGNAS